MQATAEAHPNIALVKYWGKRDAALNLPACGSLSITLDTLVTRTRVRFDDELAADRLARDGQSSPRELTRVSDCLDLLRARAGTDVRASVETSNSFPTGAGLASSASGFAALVVAASAALGLVLESRELSVLARRGSGSAARSIFAGFVEMAAGERADGEDAYAAELLAPQEWPLAVVVAVTSNEAKDISSGVGMERSRTTSPFYPAWVETTPADLDLARRAVATRDFAALAEVSEHSCLKMHATMLSSSPGLLYWSGATVDCLHRIRHLRERDGVAAFFTVDAGPQVKAVCLPEDAARVADALREVPGVQSVLTAGLGQGARVVDEDEAE
ncbi:MAG: diphosphomevalonate decarboxylase [Dermatophilaceae bacterium]